VGLLVFISLHPSTRHQALLEMVLLSLVGGGGGGVEQAWDPFRSRCPPGEAFYGRLEVGVILLSGFTGGGYSNTQVCAPLIWLRDHGGLRLMRR